MKADWKIAKLGNLASYVNGYPFKPTDWKEKGLPIIRIQNLNSARDEYHYFKGTILPRYKVCKGDILISWSASLGVFTWDGPDALLNQHIFKVVFDKEEINKEFFVYAVSYKLDEMKKLVHGATMQHITRGKFDGIDIPIPPLPEQQRIVDILDREFAKIDALKANAEKSFQAAKDLFQATLKKELEPKEGWIQYDLGTIADFKNGLNFGKEVGNCCFHFLGVGDFKNNLCIDVNTLGQIQKDEIDDDYLLHENDIVFVRSNGSKQLVGRCLLVKNAKEKATFSGFCIRCRLKGEDLLPQFLIHFCTMEETKQYLTSSGEGCNISNLNQRVLSSLTICAP